MTQREPSELGQLMAEQIDVATIAAIARERREMTEQCIVYLAPHHGRGERLEPWRRQGKRKGARS